MRPAMVPREVVYQKVWESLCKRMDPETHLVHSSWLKMMREIHVCRQRIADVITDLKTQGRIAVVTAPRKGNKKSHPEYWYEVRI